MTVDRISAIANAKPRPQRMTTSQMLDWRVMARQVQARNLERRLSLEDDAHNQSKEGSPFKERRDDDHPCLHLTGDFGLTRQAFQGGRADFSKAVTGPQNSNARAHTCANGCAREHRARWGLGQCRRRCDEKRDNDQTQKLQRFHGYSCSHTNMVFNSTLN